MQLNLPIIEHLTASKSILIAGGGGGNDVYAGLPLYLALKALGKNIHLANYTFCNFEICEKVSKPTSLLVDHVIGACGCVDIPISYYPEGYLAQWFEKVYGEPTTIWMLARTGVVPLIKSYKALVEHLQIDAIILVDGGVDSLMRGDEERPGTLVEDTVSLSAINQLEIPVKLLACLGFGTEVEEQLSHHLALENIAALARENAFLGACALVPQMEVFQLYESACRYMWSHANHEKSHIHTRIIPAVHGEFGEQHEFRKSHHFEEYISPLMSLYWFFDANAVIRRNLFITAVQSTKTLHDAFSIFDRIVPTLSIRQHQRIPY